jgi:hypothetical protein
MTRFPHLDRETAAQAELPPAERMAHILEYRFCNYPAGDLVLDKLEILFYDEAPGRQLGLAILGESGLGKSYILKHFSDNLHPQFRTRDRGMPVRPVVYLELPAEFKLSDLQEQVLAALGATANGWRGSNRDLHIKRLVKDLCVRMFIFDDIQHFTNQSPLRTSRLFDWIKYLLNDLEIAVVVAGIPSASEALHKDPQISTRFEPLTMPAWDVNDAFGQFLGNFERTFPLREPSNLQDLPMQEEILLSCNRTTRIMVRQLTDAAIFAIDQGIERIDASLLNVRSTRPKELASAAKRALVAFRRMRLGSSVALEHFPELQDALRGGGPDGTGIHDKNGSDPQQAASSQSTKPPMGRRAAVPEGATEHKDRQAVTT